MIVRDIVKMKGSNIFSIAPSGPVSEALAVMVKNDIGSLVVLEGAKLTGMLTFREILKAIDANRGAAIINDSNFNTLLVGFDLTTPTVIDTIYAPGSFALQDAELSRDGRIFVSDRTPVAPGIRVFRASDHTQITTTPIDVGLPPADIEFVLTN